MQYSDLSLKIVENNSLYNKENLMFIIKFSEYKMNEEEMEH